MSILIKGMEMPTSCMKDCPFQHFGDCYGGKMKRIMDIEDYEDKRHPRCPLVEVPTPHGRLIDADTFIKDWHLGYQCENCENDARRCEWPELTKMDICGMIEDAPTVIEADNI